MSQRLLGGFRLGNRRWYPWLFVSLCIGFFAFAYEVSGKNLNVGWIVSGLGAAGGVTTFLFTQHLQETRLFTDLFQRFNARYDELNQRLNVIVEIRDREMSPEERQALMDYFNLCAEEYLYFSAGYIDAAVWRSWTQGMKFYADAPHIRRLWEEELRSASYYGFLLSQLAR